MAVGSGRLQDARVQSPRSGPFTLFQWRRGGPEPESVLNLKACLRLVKGSSLTKVCLPLARGEVRNRGNG